MTSAAPAGARRGSASSAAPSVVAIVKGAPLARTTWSGGSFFLMRALERAGVLAAAVDARPPSPLDAVLKAAAFSPSRERWRQRYALGSAGRTASRWTVYSRARNLLRQADAILQVGAWYRFDGLPGVEPAVRASYHDGNLALYLQRPDRPLREDSARVRRALDFERRTYDRLDVIMTMSDWLRESFIEDFGQDPEKVVTVGAGANFESAPADLPDRSGLPPRFLFVGKDFERKGGRVLLEAFAMTRDEHPDAELWLVGPPRIAAPPPGVRSFGYISRGEPDGDARVGALYRDATAFVLPSVYEPFGWAFLEAMSRGLPCIGTRTCAMPEIISDGTTGLLAEPGDALDLATRMSELAADPRRSARMGEAGRDRYVGRYTWDVVAGRMAEVIGGRVDRGS